MSLLLARIDDRLIHGQVVLGCGRPLKARRIVLCDDEVAGDPMQQRIYRAAVPPEIEVEILNQVGCIERLSGPKSLDELGHTILVVAHSRTMLALVDCGLELESVNLGGAHHGPRREELWPGYFLSDEDRQALRELASRGLRIDVQSVPGAPLFDGAERLLAAGTGDDS